MVTTVEFDVKQAILVNGPFGPAEVKQIREAISKDHANFQRLRDAVNELQAKEEQTPASMVRLGVALYLLGRYYRASEVLKQADGGAMAHFYLAKSLFARGHYPGSRRELPVGGKGRLRRGPVRPGPGRGPPLCRQSAGRPDRAGQPLRRGRTHGRISLPARRHGGGRRRQPDRSRRPVRAGRRGRSQSSRALFGLALENDRYGNDDMALELYRRAASAFPTHVGSLLNLGLLYEDRDQYEKAAQCYQRVLDAYPDHARAALFFKDTEASHEQFFDDDAVKKRDRMGQVLSIPVSDFELSVRSRNCLQKMGVNTLGDLCRTSEAELLASKNFGETSLVEIKEMLASKGLRLGQLAAERPVAEAFEPEPLSADEQALLAKPVSDLNLSVRARKCMIRLGINIHGRAGPPHRRRPAGVQELRRDEPQRGPREADGAWG